MINNPVIGNFSIEIPNNWYVFDIPNFQVYITNTANFEDYYFSRITPSGHNFFIISYAQDHRGPITDDFKNVEIVEQITINGMSATKAINKNGQFGKEETVVFRKSDSSNDYLYFIYKFGDQNIFDQILFTFKFTDQEQTVCTLDAKMCPDGSYVSRQPPNCEFAACP